MCDFEILKGKIIDNEEVKYAEIFEQIFSVYKEIKQ